MLSVEESIKQNKSLDPWQRGVVNILLTYNFLNAKLSSFFEEKDLTPAQFNALRILRGQLPNACGNWLIKERLLHKNTDITRLIDRLLDKELVSRVQGKEDRRCVEITISQKGLDLLAEIDREEERMRGMLGLLTEQEVQQLNNLLDKIRA